MKTPVEQSTNHGRVVTPMPLPEQSTSVICFTIEDLELFSRASHDVSPLHTSELYARKTIFGERIVYGVLGALVCLGKIPNNGHAALISASFEYLGPLFTGVYYTVDVVAYPGIKATATIRDGKRELLRVVTKYTQCHAANTHVEWSGVHGRTEPSAYSVSDLTSGLTTEGRYAPDAKFLGRLLERVGLDERQVNTAQVVAMLWCSYLAGMEIPGERSLCSKMAFKFHTESSLCRPEFQYQAQVSRMDPRFNLLNVAGQLSDGDQLFATVSLDVFVRPPLPTGEGPLRTLPADQRTELEGKVALVIGGSRGLGASMVRQLALRGCKVLVNYRKSRAEAEVLKESLAGASGQVELLQGDASDPGWCEEMKRIIGQGPGKLDILLCVAGLPVQPMWLEPCTISRIQGYIQKNISLVAVPLATFLDMVDKSGGQNVIISSHAVTTTSPDYPHYTSAKRAIEGLVHSSAALHKGANFLLVRPPKLLTDLTNGPYGSEGALSPDLVAASITGHMARSRQPGKLGLLEDWLGD